MKAAVIVFPGSNADRDAAVAVEQSVGKPPAMVWHRDTELPKVDFIVVPGGFSYGDYLRCGAMAAHSPIMREIKRAADRGTRVLGICNGFQIITEAGLLPGVLLRNKELRFICKDVHLRVEQTKSDFTRRYKTGEVIRIPVAHAEGNFFADEATLGAIEDKDQVAFRYASPSGDVSEETNLNGSCRNIAGIFNEKRTVLGLMPHPERMSDPMLGGADGRKMFDGLVEALS